MKYLNQMEKIHCDVASAITLGKFDGFHRGHRKLVKRLLSERDGTAPVIIFTFDIPPKAYMNGEPPKMLLSRQEKRLLAAAFGVDVLVDCPFTDTLRRMEPEAFVEEILVRRMHAAWLVTGPDFRFGYERKGDVGLLEKLSRQFGYRFWVEEKELESGVEISSTRVRDALGRGDMEEANLLLGYPFHVTGEIIHGARLGRRMGMPTINQLPGKEKLLPPRGVYATTVEIEGRLYGGVTNIGYKPTVSGSHVCGVETYLLHAEGDFYGKTAKVMMHTFIREEKRFSGKEELQAQMARDAAVAERYLKRLGTRKNESGIGPAEAKSDFYRKRL